MSITRRLVQLLRPHRGMAATVFLFGLFAVAAGNVEPWLQKILIDQGIIGKNSSILLPMALAMVGTNIARGLLNFGQWYMREKMGQNITMDLRVALFRHLQRLPYSYYDQAQSGQLFSRLTSDVDSVRVFLSLALVDIVVLFLSFTTTACLLCYLDVYLTLAVLAVAPVLAIEVIRVQKRLRPAWAEAHQQMGVLTSVLQEAITGVRVVKSFAREPYEVERFDKENEKNRQVRLDLSQIWRRSFPYMDFVTALSWVILLAFGGYEVIQGRLTIGGFVAFNTYLWGLIFPIRHLGWVTNVMVQATTAGERIMEVLDRHVDITDRPHALPLSEVHGRIHYEHVCFRYSSGEMVLDGIDLKVEPGQRVAIMGSTGCGKTSLINLLLRFYEVSQGRITIDGHDLRDLRLQDLRKRVTLVPQETFLFSASIRDNIAYGRPDATDAEVIAAAKASKAHDFIEEMEEGYETTVGERGVGLSGGQKQRVALARALLAQPKILVLDDFTSAVDTETEAQIQEALQELMAGCTVLMVAQRVTSAMVCDQIVVLDGGRIAEQGTHQELLARNGYYANLFRMQFANQLTEEAS